MNKPRFRFKRIQNGLVLAAAVAAFGTTSAQTAAQTGEPLPDIWVSGAVLHKFWDNHNDNTIDALNSDPRFPDSPSFVTIEPRWEYGPDGSNGSGDNYANQLSGWFTPPQTGNYVFFTNSDDPSNLYLSTDDNPENKKLIAQEAGWSNARDWVSIGGAPSIADDKRSDLFFDTEWPTFNTITLQAGQRYYMESLHSEGGGGDSVAATFILEGDPDPVNGDAPKLAGDLIGTFLNPNGASINITQQPRNLTALQQQTVTLSVTATGTSAYGPNVGYQWQIAPAGSTSFTDISGATSEAYTTPVLDLPDSGTQYRVTLVVPTLSVTSDTATVNVEPDTVAPRIRKAVATSVQAVTVTFDEPLDAASAATTGNYGISGGITVSSAVVGGDAGNVVQLTTSGLTVDASYTLTVGGVTDLFANAVPAGTQFSFVARVVTYADIILSDEPVAFFRFEETTGEIAINSGTSGIDGNYYEGDELAAGEGGFPTTPKSGSGPQPPEFLGFDPANRSATFDGPISENWVDTNNQYLNNLGAFSLEYWVKPENRDSDPGAFGTRIGIVGQNDAIEYGFINQTTIQIWTPGGGALNTTYSFPDGEWHHIATIASGQDIRNYFDGVLVGTGGSSVGAGDYGESIYNVHIAGGGVYDATANWFTGEIDEVAIFDKAIPAERIEAHYLAGKEGGQLPGGEPPAFTGITSAGGQVTIEWTGDGTLEEASEATGPWAASGNQSNPQSVSATGIKFYRLRQ